jgi:deoxyhypusine synthase
MTVDIRSRLVPLRPLDIEKCPTVAQTVEQMEYCSIGAQTIGEVARSLVELAQAARKPILVYDGAYNTPLGKLLRRMAREKKWFSDILRPDQYASKKIPCGGAILAVDLFSRRYEDVLFNKPDRALFINTSSQFRPGQVSDRHSRDFIHCNPEYALPIMYATLEERLEGKLWSHERFMRELAKFGGVASQVSKGFEVLSRMAADPEYTVIGTFSGIMTVAKMGGLISHMIDQGWLQAIVATGALIAHGFVEDAGLVHYKVDPMISDKEYAKLRLNRITWALEPEENLDQVEDIFSKILDHDLGDGGVVSASYLNHLIGKYLAEHYPGGHSILRSAYNKNVQVFIPAPDSELDNDRFINNMRRKIQGRATVDVNNEIDTHRLVDIAIRADKLGIYTIGAGVPRNWTQNIAPLVEITKERLGVNWPTVMYQSGCRIAPDLPVFGHLGGCTYSEMVTWRKACPRGHYAEILADATMVLPFHAAALRERMSAGG